MEQIIEIIFPYSATLKMHQNFLRTDQMRRTGQAILTGLCWRVHHPCVIGESLRGGGGGPCLVATLVFKPRDATSSPPWSLLLPRLLHGSQFCKGVAAAVTTEVPGEPPALSCWALILFHGRTEPAISLREFASPGALTPLEGRFLQGLE